MEENINALNKRCKRIEEKNSNLQQPVHKIQLKSESCAEKCTWASMSPPPPNTTEEYSIPTSNTFDLLTDDAANKGDNTNEHVELKSKGNKEENVEDGVEQNDNIQQDLPPTVQPNTSAQPETKTDHQKSIDAETIIICDSNGRYLKPKELCPDSTTKYIRSPTLSQARQKIESFNFSNPQNLIIHCGTNDIEQPGKNTTTETLEIVDLVKQKHPNGRILVSSLLSRKDELNNKVPTINEELKTRLSSKTKTTYIQHTNISSADLHDKKHLNERGVKKFAKNIKAAYFNTTPKTKKMNKKYPPRDIHNQNFSQHVRTQPFQFGRNNIYPPFTP
ncbi:Hypothetical predicted protein [Paramuricea clavata]|uniref:Uncharacterized protein n=1 Tax=Paramuricea clavata TaxID=317549 RepID=A0A6S7GM93_PARCT|nr:Hypothetical predicted protein [Paramuricea clavata]